MKTEIIVTLQHEAVHNWPGVIQHPDLQSVEFLQWPHRHIFHIKCKKIVQHNDRDVEIIQFKHDIKQYLDKFVTDNMGSTSCEMLAEFLAGEFELSYCEVLEDGENGACITQ